MKSGQRFACLLFFLLLLSVGEEKKGRDWDKIKSNVKTGIEKGHELVKSSVAKNVLGAVSAVAGIAAMVGGPVGAIFSVVSTVAEIWGSSIPGQKVELPPEKKIHPKLVNELTDLVNAMGKSVVNMLDAVQNLQRTIKIEVRNLPLEAIAEELKLLQEDFDILTNNTDARTIGEFLISCRMYLIHDKPRIIKNIILEDGFQLKAAVLENMNEEVYSAFAENIGRLLYNALLLRSTCTAVKYRNSPLADLEHYRVDLEAEATKDMEDLKKGIEADGQNYFSDEELAL